MSEETDAREEALHRETIEFLRDWGRRNGSGDVQGAARQAEQVLADARQGGSELGHRMVSWGSPRKPKTIAAVALWVAMVQLGQAHEDTQRPGKVTKDALARSCGTDRFSLGRQLNALLLGYLSEQALTAYESGGAPWAGAAPPTMGTQRGVHSPGGATGA